MPDEEFVFGYSEKQMKAERSDHAKKSVAAGIVLLVFAGLCVLIGILSANSGRRVGAYPTAQARVLKCEAVILTNDDGDKYIDRYMVDIEYAVDGTTYTNNRKESKSRLEGTITVHYNPDKPGRAYFEEYVQGEGNVYWYVLAGIVGALGLGVAVSGTKDKRKIGAI